MQITRSWLIPAIVGAISFSMLLITEPHYGYAIDEASYLWVAREERAWFSELADRPLADSFSAKHLAERWHFLEPPTGNAATHSNFNLPLSMHLLNIGWLAGHWFVDELTAIRLASMVLFALTVTMVCHRFTASFSLATGLFASAALVTMPRVFGHAHLAATETALACFWTLTILSLLRLLSLSKTLNGGNLATPDGADRKQPSPFWPALIVAILLSLTMSVKLSGWFLAPAVGLWLLAVRPRGWFTAIIFSILLPIPMIVALTPPLWHDPIGGLQRYLTLVLDNPWTIGTYYLGEGYSGRLPPLSGPIILMVTTPISLLLLAVWALLRGIRDARIWAALLPTLGLVAAWMIGLLPTHDGERHLTPAVYGLALLAGQGFGLMTASWTNPSSVMSWRRGIGITLLGAILLAEPVHETWTYRDHGLLYYNRLVGGLAGAKEWGFETNYWLETVTDNQWHALLDDLPPGATVFLRPDHPGMADLKRWGVWREDINAGGPEADYYILSAKRAAYLIPDPKTGKLVETDLGVIAETGPMDKEFRFQGVRLIGRKQRGGHRP